MSVQWHRVNVHGQGVPHLRMSTKGRQLARSWTGAKAYKPPPTGTLKEWHWRALAKAYAAGDEGIEGEYGVYGRIGERTWQRLIEYKRGALVEERGTAKNISITARPTVAKRHWPAQADPRWRRRAIAAVRRRLVNEERVA